MAGPEFVAGPVAVRRIEPLIVVALRHLPGAAQALFPALEAAGLPHAPTPGQMSGQGPWALWRSPSEVTLLCTERAPAQAAMAALAQAKEACAVDLSDGVLGLELQGPQADALLQRMVDSHSLPTAPGQATRARLADVAVTLARPTPQGVWVLADRSHEHYLASWLAHAGAGVESA